MQALSATSESRSLIPINNFQAASVRLEPLQTQAFCQVRIADSAYDLAHRSPRMRKISRDRQAHACAGPRPALTTDIDLYATRSHRGDHRIGCASRWTAIATGVNPGLADAAGPLCDRRLLAPCGARCRRRRVRCSLRAWASPACDHKGRWRSWRHGHHEAA